MAIRFLAILTFVLVFPLSIAHTQPVVPAQFGPDGVRVAVPATATSVMASARRFASEEASAATARRRKGDPLWNGPLIGLAIGVGVGLIGAAGCHQYSSCGDSTGEFVALYGSIGAGVGLALDALLTRNHGWVPGKASPSRDGSIHFSAGLGGSRTGVSATWRY